MAKVCNTPGCPNLTPCADHPPKSWPNRNGTTSRADRGIKGSGWQEQARNQRTLKRHRYVCHVCGRQGATEVDHVIPLTEGGLDVEANRRPIHAKPCHAVKSAAEAARARARG